MAYIAAQYRLPSDRLNSEGSDPSDLATLCIQALTLGLSSRIVRLEAASLNRLQLPCLVQHEQLGWMPLVAVQDDQVTVQHPQQGRIRLQRDAWAVAFKGLALEFRRTP